jgi:hypothetical protein
MRRLLVVLAVAALSIVPAAAPAAAANLPRSSQPAVAAAPPAPVFAAFGSRFRFGSRSRGYGYGYGYRSRPRHSLLRRAVKTAAWLYVLHLFFSHGGLSILLWVVIIGLVMSLVRRRRRRYAYSGR